jgi:hypothetical protein
LTQDLLAEVGYIGNKGTHLTMFINQNTALPGPGDVDPRRPYPVLGATSEMANWASSHYEGLQMKIEKRFGQGLTFAANYAFGKVMDVGGSGFSSSASPQDPNDMRADRGLSSLDRRNIFSLDWVYQLPFGKGKRFGSSFNGWEEALFGGWEVTGIMTATSGSPFSAQFNQDIANIGARSISQRANIIGDPYQGGHSTSALWVNPAAFAAPDLYTFGTVGRNTLIGPGFYQWDFGGDKNFRITERFTFQFRAEIFNITNRTNFSNPANDLGSPSTFGRITGTSGAPLEAQFGAKVLF